MPLAMFVPTLPLNDHARMPVVVPDRTAIDHGFLKKKRQRQIFFSVVVHCVARVAPVARVACVARVARVARAVVRLTQWVLHETILFWLH